MKRLASHCAFLVVVGGSLLSSPISAQGPCVDNALAHRVGVTTPMNATLPYAPILSLPTGTYRYTYSATGGIPFQYAGLMLNGGTGWHQFTPTMLLTSPNTLGFNLNIGVTAPVCSATTLRLTFQRQTGGPVTSWVNVCNFDLTVVSAENGDVGNLTFVKGVSRLYYAGSSGFVYSLSWTSSGWNYAAVNPLNGWGNVRIGGRMATFDNGSRIFFKGKDSRLYNLIWQQQPAGWNLQEVLPGLPSVAGNVVARGNDEVIFVGSDHKIHRLRWVTSPSAHWDHEAITMVQIAAESESIAAVPGTPSIFFASSALPGSGWSVIGAVHQQGGGNWIQENIAPFNQPSAFHYQGGLLATENNVVYYKGRDNFIHRYVRGPNGWIFDPMVVSSAAGGLVPMGTGYLTKFPGEERVFYKDRTGRIHNIYRQNGVWHNYALSDAVTTTAGDLLAAEDKIFYINHDWRVHNFYWGDNAWWDVPLSASSPANARRCIGPYYI